MEKTGAEKSPFSEASHIGIVVKDIDEAIEYYQSLGIGPFGPSPKGHLSTDRKVYGKPADDVKIKARVAQMGPLYIELVQPVEGESLQKEFLETKGEGINHLGFFVDDIDKETAKMEKQGFKVISSVRYKGGGGAFYFDTEKVGGVMLELVQWPPE